MPRSPLTLLLLVLTLLAFVGHLIWLDAGGSLGSFFFGATMVLVLASTACVVRDGAALDDRAFHRSRPGGDSRAFRNATLTLLALAGAMALLTMVHRLIFNLDWGLVLWWAGAALVPLLFFTAAVGTASTLLSKHDGASTLRVLTLLLAPPFAVYLLLKELETPQLRLAPFSNEFFSPLSWLGLAGSGGYGLAWWLAAGVRRSRAALCVACLTGAGLPLLKDHAPLRYPEANLPEMTLAMTRKPSASDPAEVRIQDRHRSNQEKYTPVLLDGRIEVSGLREDEFIEAGLLPAIKKSAGRSPTVTLGRGYYTPNGGSYSMSVGQGSMVITGRESPEKSGRRVVLESLANRLPAPAELDLSRFHSEVYPWMEMDWLHVDEKRIGIPQVEASPWQVQGTVFRMEEAGNFDPLKGGWYRLPSGGSVRMFTAHSTYYSTTVSFRFIVPWLATGEYRPGLFDGDRFSLQPVALLRDPVTAKVRVLMLRSGSTVAGGWRDGTIELDRQDDHRNRQEDSMEILRRSRLYLFVARPVGKLSATLPPVS